MKRDNTAIRFRGLLALVISGCILAGSSVAASAEQVDGGYAGLGEGTLLLEAPFSNSELWVVPEEEPEAQEEPGISRRSAQPSTLGDGALIAYCTNPLSMTDAVEKWKSNNDGTVALTCGNKKGMGFNHIRASHPADQWKAQMGGKGSWTAYMKYLIGASLKKPAVVKNQSGNKACYQAPVKVYRLTNGEPKYWKTINPSVVISKNNKLVITAIPSTKGAC